MNKIKRTPNILYLGVITFFSIVFASTIMAESDEELAKKLANPIGSLISVPFQFNYDSNIGPGDKGNRFLINVQPVAPFKLNENWNAISRTVLPLIAQDDIFATAGSQSGIGDVVQSVFFSPVKPTSNGWIWGVGPVLLLPTATDDLLGGEKWGAGPTAVALKQAGQWSYGALANHVWSFAGDDDRQDISNTFLQPFLTYTTKGAITTALNTESTYNWETEEWTIPINLTATKVMSLGNQRVSVGGGIRYWAESTDSSPEGLGVRLIFTFLLPK